MDGSPVLELDALKRLEEWGGPTLVGKMVSLFLENAPDRMAAIRTGTEGSDWSTVERGAHSLKSSAANLGAEPLRGLASQMEKAAERVDASEIRGLLPAMEELFEATLRALRELESGERS